MSPLPYWNDNYVRAILMISSPLLYESRFTSSFLLLSKRLEYLQPFLSGLVFHSALRLSPWLYSASLSVIVYAYNDRKA